MIPSRRRILSRRASDVVGRRGGVAMSQDNWSFASQGWTLGFCAEHAFNDRWFGRIDCRFSDFGNVDYGMVEASRKTLSGDFVTHEIRFSIGVRF
jgi:opacity protein-like surface antigen